MGAETDRRMASGLQSLQQTGENRLDHFGNMEHVRSPILHHPPGALHLFRGEEFL